MDTGLVKQSSPGVPNRGSSEGQIQPRRSEGCDRGGASARSSDEGLDCGDRATFRSETNPRTYFTSETISGGKSEAGRRMEYLFVIYPYGELFEKLVEEQQQFLSDYGLIPKRTGSSLSEGQTSDISGKRVKFTEGPFSGHSLGRNRPHITVAAFQAGEQMEDTLIRWIHRICRRNERFEITLNNYSGFPPHTIYLRVQDPQPFRQLMQQLRAIDDFIRSSGCPPVNLISRPYLSIAGGLTEQIYNKAMADYSQRSFHESFQVEELVLLKREHSFDACRTVNVFRLPVNDLMGGAGRSQSERTGDTPYNPA